MHHPVDEPKNITKSEDSFRWLNSLLERAIQGETQQIWLDVQRQVSRFQQMIQLIESKAERITFIRMSFRDFLDEPFGCILPAIRSAFRTYADPDLKKILKKAVYPAHFALFYQYIRGKHPQREFELMLEERHYEKQELYTGIFQLIRKISERKAFCFMIEDAHLLTETMFELIHAWRNQVEWNASVMIITTFEQEKIPVELSAQWMNFLEQIHSDGQYRTLKPIDDGNQDDMQNQSHAGKDTSSNPLDRRLDRLHTLTSTAMIQMAIQKADTLLQFMHFAEAKQRFALLLSIIDSNDQIVQELRLNELFMLHVGAGTVYSLLSEYDQSLYIYKLALERFGAHFSAHELATIHYQISRAYFDKNQIGDAFKHVAMSLKFANQSDQKKLILKTKLLYLEIADRDRNQSNELRNQLFHEAQKLAKELNATFLLAQFMFNFLIDPTIFPDHSERLSLCDEYIRELKKYRNKFKLATAYHFRGNILSLFFEDHEGCYRYLKKSEKIKRELNSTLELIRNFNGLGYNFYTKGNYVEAIKHYNKALVLLQNGKHYDEVALTLFNVGIAYFAVEQYHDALRYFENILRILETIEMNEIPYHSLYGVYSISGICYLKTNQLLAATNLTRTLQLVPLSIYQDELFFGELFLGMMAAMEQKWEDAERWLANSVTHLLSPHWKILMPYYHEELGHFYEMQGLTDEAVEEWKKGLVIAEELAYAHQTSKLLYRISGESHFPGKTLYVKRYDPSQIIQLAKQDRLNQQMHRKVSEIHFLNQLSNLYSNQAQSLQDIAKDSIQLFHSYYDIDQLTILQRSADGFSCLASDDAKWQELFASDWIRDKIDELFKNDHRLVDFGRIYQDPHKKSDDKIAHYLLTLVSMNRVHGLMLLSARGDKPLISDDDFRVITLAVNRIASDLHNRVLADENSRQQIQLQQAAESIKQLMDNAEQGFLTFDHQLVIRPEYSLKCGSLFGADLAGKSFADVLLRNQPAEQFFFKDLIEQVLTDASKQTRDVYLTLLQDGYGEVQVGGKDLAVQFKVVPDPRNRNNEMMMAIVTDVTEQRALAIRVNMEKQKLNLVVKAMLYRHDLISLLQSFRRFIARIQDASLPSGNADQFKRDIHTFKGNFAQFGWVESAKNLHQIESDVESCEEIDAAWIASMDWNELIRVDRAVIEEKIGTHFFDEKDMVELDRFSLLDVAERLLDPCSVDDLQHLSSTLKKMTYRRIKPLFDLYAVHVEELSQRLEKPVRFESSVDDSLRLDPDQFDPLLQSLIHLFRNAIDHGIESEDDRLEYGKSEIGQITCLVEKSMIDVDWYLRISVTDDGSGIDVQKLREKLTDQDEHIQEKWQNFADDEMLAFIFETGISTKEEASEWSGRGVGLSAVLGEVQRLHGNIQVYSEIGVGTRFVIEIPMGESLAVSF